MTNTKMPSWFEGETYDKGARVTNPYSKESIELNNIELSIYDFIVGFSAFINSAPRHPLTPSFKKWNKHFLRCRDWFATNHIEAYMILID